jgi:hypothetical protein
MAYVYALLVDEVRRYIGKGHSNRHAAHMKKVRSIARRRAAGETVFATLFYNKLTKAWLDGSVIEVQFIAEGLTDEEAFNRETQEIASAPPGQLWNMAPGGKGFSTEQWKDPVFREKMEKREESKRTPEYRAKRSTIVQSHWDDPEWKAAWITKRWPQGAQGSRRDKDREQRRIEREQRHLEREQKRKQKRLAMVWKPNSGSFDSDRAKIVQLSAWRDPAKKTERLAALGRSADGRWRGQPRGAK